MKVFSLLIELFLAIVSVRLSCEMNNFKDPRHDYMCTVCIRKLLCKRAPHVFYSAITTRIDEKREARTYRHGQRIMRASPSAPLPYTRRHYRANVANPNRRVSPA